jgi:hypothetical protein
VQHQEDEDRDAQQHHQRRRRPADQVTRHVSMPFSA